MSQLLAGATEADPTTWPDVVALMIFVAFMAFVMWLIFRD